ncbi:MAG: ATP-grasp domain-containing protein [Planctomycetota bacterium]|nr:ATP-grasp domain-containing protein [Planctomycetota bacterium]
MDKPTIALFGKLDDKQVVAMSRAVEQEGGAPVTLSIGMPESGAPSVILGEKLSWGGVDFAGVESMYIRATGPNTLPAMPPMMNAAMHAEWRTRYIREQEYQAVTYSFFEMAAARGKLVVNRLPSYVDHNAKAQFYEKMRAQGVRFPKTLTTNDLARARAFLKELGDVVVKPGIGIGSTRKLREDQLERAEDFALCPVTMQEFAKGNTHRVHVVGDTVVLVLRIVNDAVDSRTQPKGFQYVKLPESEERTIVEANRRLGLHFAAWDVILTEDGRCCPLDCNPGPYIMWIGPDFVRVVCQQLARYLITYARTHSVAEASKRIEPWRPAVT